MERVVIRIDAPGAGDWVMSRVQGLFHPGWDHSFTAHRGEEILGGFVIGQYLGAGASALMHVAGEGKRWCTRELLWLVFDYGFNQLDCCKLMGQVRSDNHYALAMYLRAGGRIEAVIRDAYKGAHMLILTTTRETCPWLDYTPRVWRPGKEARCGW